MKYTFEKIHNENRWQARLEGEFVCYVCEDVSGEGYTDDYDTCLFKTKSEVVDKWIKDDGYDSREEFLDKRVSDLLIYHMK